MPLETTEAMTKVREAIRSAIDGGAVDPGDVAEKADASLTDEIRLMAWPFLLRHVARELIRERRSVSPADIPQQRQPETCTSRPKAWMAHEEEAEMAADDPLSLTEDEQRRVVDVIYARGMQGLATSSAEILHVTEQVRKGVACAHCGQPPLGSSHAQGKPLCHSGEGMDCYRLVIVDQHPMPCDCTYGFPEVDRGR